MDDFKACRFSTFFREVSSQNQDAIVSSQPPFTPVFRDLFFPCQAEIDKFERILRGDIYTLLMEASGDKDKISRDLFKKKFFHFLYRRAFKRNEGRMYMRDGAMYSTIKKEPVRKAFEILLPSILFFLDLCKCRPGTLDPKTDDYKWISRAMIYTESQIMLECCANLLRKNPRMFLITVHDCIKCHPEDVETVREELVETYAKYAIYPGFEVKYHGAKPDESKILDLEKEG